MTTDLLHHRIANQAALAITTDDAHPSVRWNAEDELHEHYESLTWREKIAVAGEHLFRLGLALARKIKLDIVAHEVDIKTSTCNGQPVQIGWGGEQPPQMSRATWNKRMSQLRQFYQNNPNR